MKSLSHYFTIIAVYRKKNNESSEAEMGGKTIVWLFQVTNWKYCTQKDMDMATKGKSQKRNTY